jgi:hypothetical protein
VLFMALPGLIAILVVGGIVIMNIMLMAVSERTREIGIRKALGAKRRDILAQFVVESATLSTVGAGFGIGAGIALAFAVRGLTPLPAAVAPWSIFVGVGLGIFVGMVPGYLATRAATPSSASPETKLRVPDVQPRGRRHRHRARLPPGQQGPIGPDHPRRRHRRHGRHRHGVRHHRHQPRAHEGAGVGRPADVLRGAVLPGRAEHFRRLG